MSQIKTARFQSSRLVWLECRPSPEATAPTVERSADNLSQPRESVSAPDQVKAALEAANKRIATSGLDAPSQKGLQDRVAAFVQMKSNMEAPDTATLSADLNTLLDADIAKQVSKAIEVKTKVAEMLLNEADKFARESNKDNQGNLFEYFGGAGHEAAQASLQDQHRAISEQLAKLGQLLEVSGDPAAKAKYDALRLRFERTRSDRPDGLGVKIEKVGFIDSVLNTGKQVELGRSAEVFGNYAKGSAEAVAVMIALSAAPAAGLVLAAAALSYILYQAGSAIAEKGAQKAVDDFLEGVRALGPKFANATPNAQAEMLGALVGSIATLGGPGAKMASEAGNAVKTKFLEAFGKGGQEKVASTAVANTAESAASTPAPAPASAPQIASQPKPLEIAHQPATPAVPKPAETPIAPSTPAKGAEEAGKSAPTPKPAAESKPLQIESKPAERSSAVPESAKAKPAEAAESAAEQLGRLESELASRKEAYEAAAKAIRERFEQRFKSDELAELKGHSEEFKSVFMRFEGEAMSALRAQKDAIAALEKRVQDLRNSAGKAKSAERSSTASESAKAKPAEALESAAEAMANQIKALEAKIATGKEAISLERVMLRKQMEAEYPPAVLAQMKAEAAQKTGLFNRNRTSIDTAISDAVAAEEKAIRVLEHQLDHMRQIAPGEQAAISPNGIMYSRYRNGSWNSAPSPSGRKYFMTDGEMQQLIAKGEAKLKPTQEMKIRAEISPADKIGELRDRLATAERSYAREEAILREHVEYVKMREGKTLTPKEIDSIRERTFPLVRDRELAKALKARINNLENTAKPVEARPSATAESAQAYPGQNMVEAAKELGADFTAMVKELGAEAKAVFDQNLQVLRAKLAGATKEVRESAFVEAASSLPTDLAAIVRRAALNAKTGMNKPAANDEFYRLAIDKAATLARKKELAAAAAVLAMIYGGEAEFPSISLVNSAAAAETVKGAPVATESPAAVTASAPAIAEVPANQVAPESTAAVEAPANKFEATVSDGETLSKILKAKGQKIDYQSEVTYLGTKEGETKVVKLAQAGSIWPGNKVTMDSAGKLTVQLSSAGQFAKVQKLG